jgi:hypothetical protein
MWTTPAMTTATSASSFAAVNNPWIRMAQRTLAQFTAVSKPERRSQKVSVSFGTGEGNRTVLALQGKAVDKIL